MRAAATDAVTLCIRKMRAPLSAHMVAMAIEGAIRSDLGRPVASPTKSLLETAASIGRKVA